MRHYWLEAELSHETWDLSVYGLTPFFIEKKGLSRKYSYESTGSYDFPVSGETENQMSLSGTLIFRSQGIVKSENLVLRFRQFIAKNTTSEQLTFNDAPFTLFDGNYEGANVIRKLRLYSQEPGMDPRYCYVMVSALQRQDKNGRDIKYSITFNMTSLWMVYRKVSFSNSTKVNISVSGDLEPILGYGLTSSLTSVSNILLTPFVNDVSILTVVIPDVGGGTIAKKGSILIGEAFDEFVAVKKYYTSTNLAKYDTAWTNISTSSNYPKVKYILPFGNHVGYVKSASGSSSSVTWEGFFFWHEKYFED